jgi:ribosomal-protein-alanine N-acetyltransferase
LIRSATPGDFDALYRLERLSFDKRRFTRDHLRWILHHPKGWTGVYDDGAIRGSIMLLREGDVARVMSVAVHPRHRRRGIGTALMTAAEDKGRAWGALSVALEVATSNEGAIAFYRALGYGDETLLSRYYTWGEDALRMAKRLR